MSLSRRTFIESLAGVGSLVAHGAEVVEQESRSGRFVSRMTEEGLVGIEWEDITPGMWIICHYWKEGKIVSLTRFKAASYPDITKSGQPIEPAFSTMYVMDLRLPQSAAPR